MTSALELDQLRLLRALHELEGRISALELVADPAQLVNVPVRAATPALRDIEVLLGSLESALRDDSSLSVSLKATPNIAAPVGVSNEVKIPTVTRPSNVDQDDNTTTDESPVLARLRALCQSLGVSVYAFRRCPEDYYERSLEARRALLQAPSVHYLCKSMVMANTKCINQDCSDPNNSKYYLVIYQYSRRFNNEKLIKFVQSLTGGKVGKSKYNFRLAPEELSSEMTGYGHNAVTPLGSKTALPVILSHHIAELGQDSPEQAFFWLGGGEVDLKLKMGVADFIRTFKPFVADLTYADNEVAAPGPDAPPL